MLLNKLPAWILASMLSMIFAASTEASLDLLAGVEAGIDTDTAMTNDDLSRTQEILSTEAVGTRHFWVNENTGTAYEIIIDHLYSYGHYPCVAYKLLINNQNGGQDKALDACKNSSGQWISITSGSMAL